MKRQLENEAINALRETLGQISVIRLKEIEVEDHQPSGERTIIARVEIYGHAHKLVCKVVGSSNSHDLQRTFLELSKLHARLPMGTTPVLIAPSLSEEAQNLCGESNTGFLDLEGNARLYLDEVFIVKRSLPLRKTLPPRAEKLPTSETGPLRQIGITCAGFLSQGGKH
jgi:hypothetical protein